MKFIGRNFSTLTGLCFLLLSLSSCGSSGGAKETGDFYQRGEASWYGAAFQGRPTASGEPFDMNDYTAAHKELSFGTKVRVESVSSGKSVVVRINDRGPYSDGRIIDLSQAAAQRIGMIDKGVDEVTIYLLD